MSSPDLAAYVRNAMTYEQYTQYVQELFASGKHTGPEQSPDYLEYTRLNIARSKRVEKTTQIRPEIQTRLHHIPKQTWLVITEGWCGDSAQQLPVIHALALASGGKIQLRIVLRDEHSELINAYLTNGSKAIPKLIAFNDELEELFVWGPRSQEATQRMQQWKLELNGDMHRVKEQLHAWYAHNKGQAVLDDLLSLLLS